MLKVNGLEMPPTFPEDTFERIYEAAERHSRQANHFQFHGAWNAVAYRFRAVTDYDHSFTASIRLHGPGAAQPTRYSQERDLFGFVSNAYSMFDAFHYGMFAIGSFLVPATFPLSTPDDERKVNFGSTSRAYASAFNGDPIVGYFATFSSDPVRQDLDAVRNMLTHRAVPPRAFRLTVGRSSTPAATVTRLMLELDQNTTATRAKNITHLLSRCLIRLEEFSIRHL